MARITIDGTELHEAPESPWLADSELVGQSEALDLGRLALGLPVGGYRPAERIHSALRAAEASAAAAADCEFFPVYLGPPGVGKTTAAFKIGHEASGGRGVFGMNCDADMRAEDLVVTPVAGADRAVEYRMSPFATAAWRGAAVVMDEASRLQPGAWASIMGALDGRRSLLSTVAGVSIPVRPGFRCVFTMNHDAETFDLLPAIRSRLGPYIHLAPLGKSDQVDLIARRLRSLPEDAIRKGIEYLERKGPGEGALRPRTLLKIFELYSLLLSARGGPSGGSQKLLRQALFASLPPGEGGAQAAD